jgi:two-component system, OmpR family, heavy metal sensor histidine kinase CusS
MRSLRGRLFVYLIGGAIPLLLAAGLGLRIIVAQSLQGEFDRALLAKARGLVALTEQEGDQVEFEFESEHMPEFGGGGAAEYFELWLADGSLLRRSPSFDQSDETRGARLPRSPHRTATPSFRDVRLPDGRRGRQIQIEFVPALDTEDDPAGGVATPPAEASSRPAATLLVAREREEIEAAVHRLELTLAGLGLGVMVALAGLAQLALRVGLRSLDLLTGQVRALDATSLETRVRVPAPPEEIAVVVEQVNALLARLEAAFRRERRLSSDIAHELKTPIAELRNLSEVGARWP